MSKITGYCILTNTISGYELVWSVEEPDNGGEYPEVFLSEQEARQSMIDDLYEDLRQYREGTREWDEIKWPNEEYEVCPIEISEEGNIIVWSGSEKYLNRVITTSLSDWRANR